MRRIDKFAFEHRAPGQDLDATSTSLLVDGKPVGVAIEGLQIVDQFDTGRGYLLVTDYNDPWEEQTVVTLLDAEFKQVANKSASSASVAEEKKESKTVISEGASNDKMKAYLERL